MRARPQCIQAPLGQSRNVTGCSLLVLPGHAPRFSKTGISGLAVDGDDPMQPLALMAEESWPRGIMASVAFETFRLATPFVIARGSQEDVSVAVVTLQSEGSTGRGESCPVGHYGETRETVCRQIEAMLVRLCNGAHWTDIHDDSPVGAARNAVDCAVWDLVAKINGKRIHEILRLSPPRPIETVFTLSVDTPGRMASAALKASRHSKLKLKLGGGPVDCDRVRAVRRAVPGKILIADVNEYWTPDMLEEFLPVMAELDIRMLEQPLRAGADAALSGICRRVLIGADESCHVAADLDPLCGRYDVVNIKLDKTGGLTEALRLKTRARELGFQTMTGCMLGTSLAMAPAHLLAQECDFVDIDAPLLIGTDRPDGLLYEGGLVYPSTPGLWG